MSGEERRMAAFARHPACLWRRTLDGVVVLPPTGSDPLHITGAGSIVWALLAEPATVDELAREVGSVYRRPAAEVQADVEGVVAMLADSGAIAPSGGRT